MTPPGLITFRCPTCGRVRHEPAEEVDDPRCGGYFCESGHRPVMCERETPENARYVDRIPPNAPVWSPHDRR